jgi:hypothetical protein
MVYSGDVGKGDFHAFLRVSGLSGGCKCLMVEVGDGSSELSMEVGDLMGRM